MAQQYDTTGKDILNEQINEIARFVLNVPDVEVIADLDTEQQVVRAVSHGHHKARPLQHAESCPTY